MVSIFWKEINTFFSSLIGYIVIGVFLLLLGLVVWVFPDTSLLNSPYASLDPLFDIAPNIFMFLIPAVTMRSFADEHQSGTIEMLATKPLTDWQITNGKFLSHWVLTIVAIVPTLLYFLTMHELGSPKGNLDSGAIAGSYFGLVLLAGCFTAIGIFASALSTNQIVSFVLGTFLCFIWYYGFYFFSKLPIFYGYGDEIVQMFGIDHHYSSISRGVIDSRDVLYFGSLMVAFLAATVMSLEKRKW